MTSKSLLRMTCMAILAMTLVTHALGADLNVGTQVFGDDFSGTALDSTKWTSAVSGSFTPAVLVNVNYPGTHVEIYSAGHLNQMAHIDTVNNLTFTASPNDWWAQVAFQFPVQGGVWAAPNASVNTARQYIILQGKDANGPTQGNAQGFDLRAVRYGPGLWGLAWYGIDDTSLRIAEILDDNAGAGYAFSDTQTYVASVHRKSDGNVDIYFDTTSGDGSASNLIATKPLILGLNPVGLTAGEFSVTCAGYLLIDYVKIGANGVPGDFDTDGDVDGADFVAWQTNFPKPSGATLAQGDADGDGDVDGADFVVWQTNFPTPTGPGASPVPEPQSLALLNIGGLLVVGIGLLRHRAQRASLITQVAEL